MGETTRAARSSESVCILAAASSIPIMVGAWQQLRVVNATPAGASRNPTSRDFRALGVTVTSTRLPAA
jgi:hypothetical protein